MGARWTPSEDTNGHATNGHATNGHATDGHATNGHASGGPDATTAAAPAKPSPNPSKPLSFREVCEQPVLRALYHRWLMHVAALAGGKPEEKEVAEEVTRWNFWCAVQELKELTVTKPSVITSMTASLLRTHEETIGSFNLKKDLKKTKTSTHTMQDLSLENGATKQLEEHITAATPTLDIKELLQVQDLVLESMEQSGWQQLQRSPQPLKYMQQLQWQASQPVSPQGFHLIQNRGLCPFGTTVEGTKTGASCRRVVHCMPKEGLQEALGDGWATYMAGVREALSIQHPLLVSARYAMQDAKTLFLVMPLVHGCESATWGAMRPSRLEQKLGMPAPAALGPLNKQQLQGIAADVVAALMALHSRGVTHGHVDGSNVLLCADGHARLLPHFACHNPSKEAAGAECDWRALGKLLFELATRQRWHFSEEEEQAGARPTVLLDSTLEALVQALTHPDPSQQLVAGAQVMEHPFFQDVDWPAVNAGAAHPQPELAVVTCEILSTAPVTHDRGAGTWRVVEVQQAMRQAALHVEGGHGVLEEGAPVAGWDFVADAAFWEEMVDCMQVAASVV